MNRCESLFSYLPLGRNAVEQPADSVLGVRAKEAKSFSPAQLPNCIKTAYVASLRDIMTIRHLYIILEHSHDPTSCRNKERS